jgi:hypothetical protein
MLGFPAEWSIIEGYGSTLPEKRIQSWTEEIMDGAEL